MISKTIHNPGTLSSVPKTIVVRGKRYEQSVGAHTLSEIKKFKNRYDSIYPNMSHIIVKSVNENKPYHTSWGVQTFYWIYQRSLS